MVFCVLGDNCVVYDSHTKLAGVAVNSPICRGCHDATRATLNLLRYDYIDLSQLIPKPDTRSDGKIFRPKPESSPPINVAAWTLRGQIAYVVGVVAQVVRREMGCTPRTLNAPVREGFALDGDVRFLLERVDTIAMLPGIEHYWLQESADVDNLDGPQIIGVLHALHRRARMMCGLDPRTITVPGDCPACETPSLRRPDDDPDRVWCQHCRQKMTAEEYNRAMRLQIPAPRNPQD